MTFIGWILKFCISRSKENFDDDDSLKNIICTGTYSFIKVEINFTNLTFFFTM